MQRNYSSAILILVSVCKVIFEIESNSDENPRVVFEQEGGVDIWEFLQQTPNVEIFGLAQKLLKDHYPDGEDYIVEQEMNTDEKIMF